MQLLRRCSGEGGNEAPHDDLMTVMKGLGYLVSTVSVILLGIVAWPGPDEPKWKLWLVLTGCAASVLGMFIRYLSHLRDRRDIHQAKTEARTK